MEHPAAVQRIEGIGVPSAAFVDQAAYIRTVRAGLSREIIKQAIDAIGHRDFFVRLPARIDVGDPGAPDPGRTADLAPEEVAVVFDAIALLRFRPALSG